MKSYDPGATCPKCGAMAGVAYCNKECPCVPSPEGEHLRRDCRRCGYRWQEGCVLSATMVEMGVMERCDVEVAVDVIDGESVFRWSGVCRREKCHVGYHVARVTINKMERR